MRRRVRPLDTGVLIQQGGARPLRPGSDPVPVTDGKRWWHAPADAAPDATYVVASPAQHEVFDDLAGRLALADAATLFSERAHAVQPDAIYTTPDIEAIEAICARVDCLPLGIELIAPQVGMRSLAELRDQL